MADLTTQRATREERITYRRFMLKDGDKAVKGTIVCLDPSSGLLASDQHAAGLKPLGLFAENLDNSLGSDPVPCNVRLFEEIVCHRFDNDPGGGAIDSGDLGKDCYILDNHTVSLTTTSATRLGVVVDVDDLLGVLVHCSELALADIDT